MPVGACLVPPPPFLTWSAPPPCPPNGFPPFLADLPRTDPPPDLALQRSATLTPSFRRGPTGSGPGGGTARCSRSCGILLSLSFFLSLPLSLSLVASVLPPPLAVPSPQLPQAYCHPQSNFHAPTLCCAEPTLCYAEPRRCAATAAPCAHKVWIEEEGGVQLAVPVDAAQLARLKLRLQLKVGGPRKIGVGRGVCWVRKGGRKGSFGISFLSSFCFLRVLLTFFFFSSLFFSAAAASSSSSSFSSSSSSYSSFSYPPLFLCPGLGAAPEFSGAQHGSRHGGQGRPRGPRRRRGRPPPGPRGACQSGSMIIL